MSRPTRLLLLSVPLVLAVASVAALSFPDDPHMSDGDRAAEAEDAPRAAPSPAQSEALDRVGLPGEANPATRVPIAAKVLALDRKTGQVVVGAGADAGLSVGSSLSGISADEATVRVRIVKVGPHQAFGRIEAARGEDQTWFQRGVVVRGWVDPKAAPANPGPRESRRARRRRAR